MVVQALNSDPGRRKAEVRLNLPAGAGGPPVTSSHPVRLCGLGASAGESPTPPLIVRRTEDDFLSALFAGLTERKTLPELGLPDVLAHPDDFRDGHRCLYQPVHRTFNCVLIEVACQRPGFPRLDPRHVDSAGCVVRRIHSDHSSQPEWDEAWLHREGSILGWRALPFGHGRLDPDPKRRVRSPLAISKFLHDRLAALLTPVTEGIEPVSPLFVAPPEVCNGAEKTIVYGVVPVTSGEERTVPRDEPVDLEVVEKTTPGFLIALNQDYYALPPDSRITLEDVKNALKNLNEPLAAFLDDVGLVASVWGAFDDTPEAQEVVRQLNRHRVQAARAETPSTLEMRPLGDYLAELVRRLVLQTEPGDVLFPHVWTQPPATVVTDIRKAARDLLSARFRSHGPRLKRFDEPDALYRLHCFVRIRCPDGCPPELHWAEPSQPFSIAPWWDSSGTPVHTISLPDLTPEAIKRLKPNVAFVLPPKLAALLNQDPEKLVKGEAEDPGNVTLGWICSFSLPIITLCAFIVLNIFLSLFKLVFSLLFGFAFSLSLGFGFSLKLCLPFPKVNSRPRP